MGSRINAARAAAPARPALLAVDDDEGVRDAYAVLFEEWMDVVGVASAATALAAARQRRFEAILLDIRMPRVSGLEVFDALRALQPGVPIVFVTGIDTAGTALTAMRLGAFDYVTKPFDVGTLSNVVRRAAAAAGGVVSVIGGELGICAATAVLAMARAGVPVGVGTTPGSRRTVCGDGSVAELYMAITPGAAPISDLVARVATYVGSHYARVTVELLAKAIGLTPGHLSRAFREETSLSAKEYMTRVRIEIARALLRETRETFETIAERVGLCDGSHLTRIFRQHIGTTPGEYRSSPSAPTVPPPAGARR